MNTEDIPTASRHNKIEDNEIFQSTDVSSGNVSSKHKSYQMKVFGHTIDYVENVDTSNTNVGNIAVQNSSNVSLGDKTFFNQPVIMKGVMIDNRKGNMNSSEDIKDHSKQTNGRRMIRSTRKHRCLICSILALVVVVIIFVVVAHVLHFFGRRIEEPKICEEMPSNPSHYVCGLASACTRCKALYPNKDILYAYYESDCAVLRCFSETECTPLNC